MKHEESEGFGVVHELTELIAGSSEDLMRSEIEGAGGYGIIQGNTPDAVEQLRKAEACTTALGTPDRAGVRLLLDAFEIGTPPFHVSTSFSRG